MHAPEHSERRADEQDETIQQGEVIHLDRVLAMRQAIVEQREREINDFAEERRKVIGERHIDSEFQRMMEP